MTVRASEPTTGRSTPAHILIVDDLEVNRDLLARRVKRLGHSVGFAATGREALSCLRAVPYDLVLLDITMPDMDGYEALAQIKADTTLADLPVVMVTAIDGVDSVVRCLELGAEDYITKPFNPVVLRARVEASLNKKRVADLNAQLLRSMSREMAIAQKIQRGFLPDALPQLPGWPVAAVCVPARQVGGDFYDVLLLPDGRLVMIIADVCDKGVGAALYMALFRSLLRISLLQAAPGLAADQMLSHTVGFTNDYVASEHARDNMFATAFIALLDPASGQLDYINAGHDAPFLLRAGVQAAERLQPESLALGVMPNQAFVCHRTVLGRGDRILLTTDGLPEALNPQDQAFGELRVAASIGRAALGPQALIDSLYAELAQHVDGRQAHDDVTMLCLFAHATS